MNSKQFSQRIGNMDDRLVQQAEQLPNYGVRHRRKHLRAVMALAASIAMMVCSFSVGALAYSREIIVEVPAQQEIIELSSIGLTLILPDSWKNAYGVEINEDGSGCSVYVKSIHESSGDWAGTGYLFLAGKFYDTPMTPEELEAVSPVPCRYLFSTVEGTYTLAFASDVQWDPGDPQQAALYQRMMAESTEIQFVVTNALAD